MRRPLVVALAIALPSPAAAFEAQTTSTGEPLRWPSGPIVIELSMGKGPAEIARADAEEAAAAAAASWQTALEGSSVSLSVGARGGDPIAAAGDGSASLRWAMSAEDPGIEVGVLGVTQISYRSADGAIQDADVVVNAVDYTWTAAAAASAACATQYDLESTLAHEFGHLLGLTHPPDHPEATMFATATECETIKRDLSDDDIAGLDHLYRDLAEPLTTPTMPTTVAPSACSAAGGSSALSSFAVAVAALLLARRPRGASRKRRSIVPVVAAAIAIVAGLAATGTAAQLRMVELAELGGHADLVVRAVVLEMQPAPDGELATDSLLEVRECVAGDCPALLEVRRRGGEQGERGLWVDGEAELVTGAEVVLYLRARPDGLYRVVGGVHGLLRVARQGDAVYAVRDLRGHRVLDRGTWRPGTLEVVDMAAVRRSVQGAVAR